MREIEKHNVELNGVLAKCYNLFKYAAHRTVQEISEIPASVDYVAFGRIYE
jgi:type I restriction enzyme M protein